MPLFVFFASLAAALSLSALFLLPLLTRVEIDGKPQTIEELRSMKQELQQKLSASETERQSHLRGVRDPLAAKLRERRTSDVDMLMFKDQIERTAASVAPKEGAIAIGALWMDADQKLLSIRGDVRFVGPRSITVLAAFTDAIGGLPGVLSVDQPQYVREEDPTLGFHSPFSLIAHLK